MIPGNLQSRAPQGFQRLKLSFFLSTFVEVHIANRIGIVRVFKKSVKDNRFVYEFDGAATTPEYYSEQLRAAYIVRANSNMVFIDSKFMDNLTSMSDNHRTAFIELFCDATGTIDEYKRFETLMVNATGEVDELVRKQKELNAEKKKIKKDTEATEERAALEEDLTKSIAHHDLLNMFANKNFLDSVDESIEAQKVQLDSLKQKKFENLKDLEESANLKATHANEKGRSDNKLQALSRELQDSQEKCHLAQHKSESVNLQNSSIERHTALVDSSRQKLISLKEEINELKQLESQRDAIMEHFKEYSELRSSFDEDNSIDRTVMDALKSTVDNAELKSLEARAKHFSKTAGDIKDKIAVIECKLEQLRATRSKKVWGMTMITKLNEEAENAAQDLKDIEKSFKKIEQKSSDQRIIDELKAKFGESKVLGRVADLWTPIDDEDGQRKKFIEKRLGEFNNAIVVDTDKTAEKCAAFLKIKNLYSYERFVNLEGQQARKPSKSLLLFNGLEVPEIGSFEFIEDRVKFTTERKEVGDVIMKHLKPAIVCGSLQDAEKNIRLEAYKKLDVISTEAGTYFSKQGFIERDGNIDDAEPQPSNLDGALKKRNELQQGSMQKRLAADIKVLEKELLSFGKQRTEEAIDEFKKFLSDNEKQLSEATLEMEKVQAEIDDIVKNDDPVTAARREFVSNLQAQFAEREKNHFAEFCRKVNVADIEKYDTTLAALTVTETYRKIKLLEKEMMSVQSVMKETDDWLLKASLRRGQPIQTFDDIMKELSDKKAKFSVETKRNDSLNLSSFEIISLNEEYEERDRELTNEICKVYESMYNEVHRREISFMNDYKILMKNFMDHNPVKLERGSIVKFVVPPGEVPQGFILVRDQMNQLEVDFKKLRKNLKNHEDVAFDALQVKKRIEKIRSKLDSAGGKIGEDGSRQRLRRISENLTEICSDMSRKRRRMDEIEFNFERMKKDRRDNFANCLNKINSGIDDFCRLALQDVTAKLEMANTDEPYHADVAYFWRTIEDPENRVTELQKNYAASLALLFGLLSFRQQQIVILVDVMKESTADIESFCEKHGNIQVICLTQNYVGDDSDYCVRRTPDSFIVSRNDH